MLAAKAAVWRSRLAVVEWRRGWTEMWRSRSDVSLIRTNEAEWGSHVCPAL